MGWFGVKIIRRAAHDSSPQTEDLYDEMVIVVAASGEEAALEKATRIAGSQTPQYVNVYGETVTWTVQRVLRPFEIEGDELRDGLEVYGRYYYIRDGREVSPEELPD